MIIRRSISAVDGRKFVNHPARPDIVIPTFRPDREKLSSMLDRLYTQTRKPGTIIIVNTGREYWDTELEKKYPSLRVIHIREEEFDHGETRNLGWRAGDGEIVVFMTQDAMPADENLLENLCRHFENDPAACTGAVYAKQIPDENCSWLEKETRAFNYPDRMRVGSSETVAEYGIKAYFCSNVCAAYRRHVLEEAGGFDRPCIFGEDMLAAADMIHNGYRILYDPEAAVIHSHTYTLRQQFRRNFDIGVCHARNSWLFDTVPGTGEGVRLVKSLAVKSIRSFHPGALPEIVLVTGAKYAGYRLGKSWKRLPKSVVKRFSANEKFWDRI